MALGLGDDDIMHPFWLERIRMYIFQPVARFRASHGILPDEKYDIRGAFKDRDGLFHGVHRITAR